MVVDILLEMYVCERGQPSRRSPIRLFFPGRERLPPGSRLNISHARENHRNRGSFLSNLLLDILLKVNVNLRKKLALGAIMPL